MPIARSVDRNLKFTLVQSALTCPSSPPWTVSDRYMITPVGAGLGAATQSGRYVGTLLLARRAAGEEIFVGYHPFRTTSISWQLLHENLFDLE